MEVFLYVLLVACTFLFCCCTTLLRTNFDLHIKIERLEKEVIDAKDNYLCEVAKFQDYRLNSIQKQEKLLSDYVNKVNKLQDLKDSIEDELACTD